MSFVLPKYEAGEKSRTAKLTERQVFDMLDDYKEGMTQRALAKKYHVAVGTINRIVSGRGWKTVERK